jgi:hypothetical protein
LTGELRDASFSTSRGYGSRQSGLGLCVSRDAEVVCNAGRHPGEFGFSLDSHSPDHQKTSPERDPDASCGFRCPGSDRRFPSAPPVLFAGSICGVGWESCCSVNEKWEAGFEPNQGKLSSRGVGPQNTTRELTQMKKSMLIERDLMAHGIRQQS